MERESNIEILRIVSMLLIFFGHFLEQSGAMSMTHGFNQLFAVFCGSGLRIATNIFLMIGCWFMVSIEFKPVRVLRIHSEMLFYLLPISIIILIAGFEYEKKDFIKSLFPFILHPVWFGSAYMVLLLMSPFLKILNQEILQRGGGNLWASILLLSSVGMSLQSNKVFDSMIDNIAWFSIMYSLVYIYKPRIQRMNFNKYYPLLSAIGFYSILCCAKFFLYKNVDDTAFKYIETWLKGLNSLPNLAISLGFFYFFIKTDMGRHKFVNLIAKSSFAVYIVHQAPMFYPILWNHILCVQIWWNSAYFPLLVVASGIGIYAMVTIIDSIKIRYVDPIIMSSRVEKNIERWLLNMYKQFV